MPTTLRLTARQFAALKPSKVQRASGSSVRAQASGEQMRLRLGGERKATMTQAQRRALATEAELRSAILDACQRVTAWTGRFERYAGRVLPAGQYKALVAALHKRQHWSPNEALALLERFTVWREFGSPGAPDLLGQLRNGTVLGLEVKRPGGKAEEHQQRWLDHATKYGACCAVVHSVDEAIERIRSFEAVHGTACKAR